MRIVAFDTKEFRIPGRTRDFFCLLGIGLEIKDVRGLDNDYCRLIVNEAKRLNFPLSRRVYGFYALTRMLGGQDTFCDFYMRSLQMIRSHFGKIYVYFMTVYPGKVPRLYVYEERTESKTPVDFLNEHKAGFVVLCAWKYSESVPDS